MTVIFFYGYSTKINYTLTYSTGTYTKTHNYSEKGTYFIINHALLCTTYKGRVQHKTIKTMSNKCNESSIKPVPDDQLVVYNSEGYFWV